MKIYPGPPLSCWRKVMLKSIISMLKPDVSVNGLKRDAFFMQPMRVVPRELDSRPFGARFFIVVKPGKGGLRS